MAAILTVNAGSSSLKFSLFGAGDMVCHAIGQVDGLGTRPRLTLRDGSGSKLPVEQPAEGAMGDHAAALGIVLKELAARFPHLAIAAIGHRVVHGGTRFVAPVVVDGAVEDELRALVALAPLHQPHNLAGIAAGRAAFPGVPQVACFDTAFHSGRRFVDDTFAIPRALYEEGVRRYGFHGLSYEYVTGELARIAPHHAAGRVIICHLGSGASMCATNRGRSMASTMGFTALDGLPMGTRPGQLDPGVVLHLMTHKGMSPAAVTDLLYKESGLKGLSGVSNDMRDLEASENPHAKQAIDYFVFRCRREIGGLAAVLEGLDAIVFCGGIGENAWRVREAILANMEWIGVELDFDRNRAAATVISSDRSRVRVFIIPTNEELVIARHTAALALAPTPSREDPHAMA